MTKEENSKLYQRDYIITNQKGNATVNTSLLAEYIRANSHYYIVKKQGSETFFIYWYDGGYYKQMSAGEVKAMIKEFIPMELRRPTVWEDTYKDLISTKNFISFEQLNSHDHFINFKNGILGTKEWKLIDHDPQYNLTHQIQFNYNENAPVPKNWKTFIETLVSGDIDTEYTLQEWFGVNISNYNVNLCKKSLALCGVVGNTGKSKFLKMLGLIIGLNNICSKSIQDLSARFGAGALYGKKCVLIDDQKAANIEDGSTFKAITGDGVIEAELKGKDPFAITFKGGITFTCNEMSYIKDDKGTHMFERFLIIPCNNVIPPEKRDNKLFEKMEGEIEGIIIWALQGLKRLMQNGFVLTESKMSKSANADYRSHNDSLFRFIKENCIVTGDRSDKIRKTEFEARYNKYCTENDITPLDKKNIKVRAEKNGIPCVLYEGYPYYRGLKYVAELW
ncbi:phage/plasmid primase, P4 family [Cellulosilyticum sp. ST5]|uniref:DNA primase family protein n=1 Tax=unclassified Cellulosilyticum TaxID=2643091 RepID=UPI000F8E8642|nr:DNA primase family protein [Cellulosilyticum sp. WCF-2]QEH69302.1 hypothetical protein EKH84_13215 [Cellulosilyticum sp. WCF-2]